MGGTEQQKWLFPLSLSHGNFLGFILLNTTYKEEKRPLVQSTGGEMVSIVAVAFAPAKSCPQLIEEDAYTNTSITVGYSSGGDFWASFHSTSFPPCAMTSMLGALMKGLTTVIISIGQG